MGAGAERRLPSALVGTSLRRSMLKKTGMDWPAVLLKWHFLVTMRATGRFSVRS